MRDFGDDAEAIDGDDDFFDGVDDFSDDRTACTTAGGRRARTIHVDQTSPLPAPASLESAGRSKMTMMMVCQAAAALIGFGDKVEDDGDDESRASGSPRARQSETFDSDDEPAAVPDFAYELLASIVAGLAWRKEQSILMETFIKWLEFAGDAAQASTPPASPSKLRAGRRSRRHALRRHAMRTSPRRSAPSDESESCRGGRGDVVQREERCAAVERMLSSAMERLVKAGGFAGARGSREEAGGGGCKCGRRRGHGRRRPRCARSQVAGAEASIVHGTTVKVEPNEWADAVAASAEHHARELSLENKQLKRHQRHGEARAARRGRVTVAEDACARCADRGAKSGAAWYVFSQNTQPSTKQKRVGRPVWS